MKNITLTCSQLIGGIVVGLMCFAAGGTSSAQTPKQDSTVTFLRDSMIVKEAIDSIEKWTFYVFELNGSIDLRQMVPVGYKNIPVRKLLEIWFKEQPVESIIQGVYIGFKAKKPVFVRPDVIDILYGRVTDKNGHPIDKASVRLNNAASGPTTDTSGNFLLFNVPVGAALSISCVGRVTHETTVPRSNSLDIILEEQTNSVPPVEITGIKQKKRQSQDSTYRFPEMRDITRNAQSNVLDDLSGTVPGALVLRDNGRAAASRSIEIRGITSLNRNSQALYLVDGVPVPPDFKGGEGTMSQYSSTLSYLPIAVIDTIIVLKGAMATALYGARGANGVILIFTKKASHTETTNVLVDVGYSWGRVPRRERLLKTDEYLQLRRDAWKNDDLPPTIAKAPDMLDWDTLRYTDWQKELIGNTALYKDAIVTVSGEKGAIQYLASGNFRENSTPYMREGNKYGDRKYGLHSSVNMKLWDSSLVVSSTGQVNVNETSLPGADYTTGISLPPNAPPLFKDGKINYALSNAVVSMPDFKGRVSNIFATTHINYRAGSSLSFMLTAGYHRMGARNTSITTIAKRGEEGQDNLTASSTENRYLSKTFVMEFSGQFTMRRDSRSVTLDMGAVYNSIYAGNTTIDAEGYLRDQDILHYDRITTVTKTPTFSRYKYAGTHARLNYDWKGRYTLEAIVRLDGSSRFGIDEQVNVFGGGAAGWEFGKEVFIQHALPGLSYGKVQFGWSATGNDQIGDYQYAGSYQPAGRYQSVNGLMAAKQQNKALTGGMTYKKDVTLNLSFLNNKWEIEAAYYHNRSKHQLVEYPLPEIAGGGAIQQNMPVTIQNHGVELMLNASIVQSKHWNVDIRFNASKGVNTLLSFHGMTAAPSGQTQLKRPLRELFYYDFYGVDPEDGLYLYRNRLGDIVKAAELTENDRTVAVNTSPRFYGGFGFTCTFHGLEVTGSWQYMVRTAENGIIDKLHMVGTMWNQNSYVTSLWRKTGDHTMVQKATQVASAEADYKKYLSSDAVFMDVWYLRMNNLTVAYQFRQYKVYCNVSNPFTFTNYQSLDPESLSKTSLPFLRIIKVGVQYNFK